MVKLISHRGKLKNNDYEAKTEKELEKKLNNIRSINIMIELDFWIDDDDFCIGYDKENSFPVAKELVIHFQEVIFAHIKNPLANQTFEFFSSNNIEHFVHSVEPIIFTSKGNPFCHAKYCNDFKKSKKISLIMPERVMSKNELTNYNFPNPFILTECIDCFV